ncbi:hypothetical protein EGW08_008309 [Elysia chlorotica]|uniref:Uncharacterized protein n=1 Tax=Elysia chlorotica TaxID=188477 RepID=A0A433TQW6_ELYCH|nr:hypothetical protein EGW08_008309 [Elysia chlorotica]
MYRRRWNNNNAWEVTEFEQKLQSLEVHGSDRYTGGQCPFSVHSVSTTDYSPLSDGHRHGSGRVTAPDHRGVGPGTDDFRVWKDRGQINGPRVKSFWCLNCLDCLGISRSDHVGELGLGSRGKRRNKEAWRKRGITLLVTGTAVRVTVRVAMERFAGELVAEDNNGNQPEGTSTAIVALFLLRSPARVVRQDGMFLFPRAWLVVGFVRTRGYFVARAHPRGNDGVIVCVSVSKCVCVSVCDGE